MIAAILIVVIGSVLLKWDSTRLRPGIGGGAWLVSALLTILMLAIPASMKGDPIAVGFSTLVIFALAVPVIEEMCRAWGLRGVRATCPDGLFAYGLWWAVLELWVNSISRWFSNLVESPPGPETWVWSWPFVEMSLIALSSVLVHPVNTLILARYQSARIALAGAILLHAVHNVLGLAFVAGDLPSSGVIAARLVLLAAVIAILRLRIPTRERALPE